MNQDLLYW